MTPDLFASITPERKKYLATMVYISQTIRNARKERGMTQAEFAEYMDVKQNIVSRWESGHHNFSLETVVTIYTKLGIPLNCEKPKADNSFSGGFKSYVEKYAKVFSITGNPSLEGTSPLNSNSAA